MQSLSNHVTFACDTLANIIRKIIKIVLFYILSKQICENIYVYSWFILRTPLVKIKRTVF